LLVKASNIVAGVPIDADMNYVGGFYLSTPALLASPGSAFHRRALCSSARTTDEVRIPRRLPGNCGPYPYRGRCDGRSILLATDIFQRWASTGISAIGARRSWPGAGSSPAAVWNAAMLLTIV
jgi:hypothetical protein